MATAHSPTSLRDAFNPTVFEKIRKLWFQNVTDDTQLILPTEELAKQWFTSNAAFDKVCSDTFGDQLRIIQSGSVTASALLDALTPLSPLDWLGLVLLLDQIPRNCFRGAAAKTAFTVFDPVSIAVTLQAIRDHVPDSPEIKYHAGYRLWFYLPLQHSEDPEIHDLSMQEHSRIATDMHALMDTPEAEVGDENLKACRAFLLANRGGVDKWDKMLVGFAARHKAVIDRFGRYPHRNQALGRESTEEEVKYLAEGGETFSSGN